jgi:hypothetical protein
MNKYSVSHMPLWNTESGFLVHGKDKPTRARPEIGQPFDRVLSEDVAAGYVLRAMVLAAVSGVSRFYHYSWDIPTMHLMSERGRSPTNASAAYAQAIRWLRGSTIRDCVASAMETWTCPIRSANGKHGILAWSERGEGVIRPLPRFSAIGFETLDGHFHGVPTSGTIPVGANPVLIRSEKDVW